MDNEIWFNVVEKMYKTFCHAFPYNIRRHCWWYMGENILWDSVEERKRTKYEIIDWAILFFTYMFTYYKNGSDPIHVLSLQTNSNDNGFLIS